MCVLYSKQYGIYVLLEDYLLTVERRFARPSDPEIYAGWSVICW
jgi:hypothetical protein